MKMRRDIEVQKYLVVKVKDPLLQFDLGYHLV